MSRGIAATARSAGVGSYAIESLTDEIEARRIGVSGEVLAGMGGMLKAIERGFVQQEIQRAVHEYQRSVDAKVAIVVGVNEFAREVETPVPTQRIDEIRKVQVDRL